MCSNGLMRGLGGRGESILRVLAVHIQILLRGSDTGWTMDGRTDGRTDGRW